MAVSSTPFKISCPSPLWVPRSCPCSSSSWPASTALRRRNCWPVHRREMCFLQSPYQYPSNVVPFCGCVHIKQQNSSFSTKLHLDANTGWIDSSSQHMVSGQPSYYRSAKPGSLSPTVGNYERLRFREEDGSAHVHMYGMTGRGEQKLVKSHNDFLPSPLSEYSWSSATFEMKESKKVYRQGTVNVKTSSDLDKANGSAYENSDLNGGFGRLKFDTLSRSGVINSPCIDVHEKIDRVNLRTHKELDEPENVKQLNHGNGKAGKVKQLGTEDRENPRFEDSTGHEVNGISSESVPIAAEERVIVPIKDDEVQIDDQLKLRSRLCGICNKVLVVDSIQIAREVVGLLTNQYRHLVYACDTEVSDIDVKQETPVNHGKIICFSIYSDKADFGHGKSCLWVDILDGGGKDLLAEFAPFFEDPSIQKVWHNYSFDSHIVSNYGIQISGFHADTMHMARLWDSSRRTEGGYSLEALTRDPKIFLESQIHKDPNLIGKVSMKTLFGRRKMKKDGSLGKVIAIPPVEELQREDREPWICYSSLDSISTLKLYESLRSKLSKMPWTVNRNKSRGSMFDFYRHYWRPFGELLVKMEAEGMLVDRSYLAEVEKVAISEQQVAADRFRTWASRYCPDAKYMNVGSDTQLRQLLFGGISNRKNPDERLPDERTFRVPNLDNIIEEGKKTPKKYRDITLRKLDIELRTESFTPSGWPSVSADALKILAGKVSAEYDFSGNSDKLLSFDESGAVEEDTSENIDASVYGTAYDAFNGGQEGREVCHAIAALCEVCSMDSLISNFILPLQGSHVSGKTGRVHCSLNINTETGRLSARRPNLQNQPALEKDRYKIRQAFIASPGNSLIVADYGQLELRILAHLADCKSMKEAFEAGGDFHSRTAMNMYSYIREAVERKEVLLEWHPQPGEDKPPVPLLKDAFGSERRKAKMLNFSIAYGKTPMGLAKDWKVSVQEAKKTVDLWYKERQEVRKWQEARKREALETGYVHTLLGRARRFPLAAHAGAQQRSHVERAAINTPVQGSAADVAMCAMLEIANNARLKELGWRLLLQVHDEVILEGPRESEEEAKALVVNCMSKPFNGTNILNVELVVDANCSQNWYAAK